MLEALRPTVVAGTIDTIDLTWLLERLPEDITALTYDFDRTLTGHHDQIIPPENFSLILQADRHGYQQGIISNAGSEKRTKRVLAIAAEISTLLSQDLLVVTSRMVDGKRKPLRPIFDKMAGLMGMPNAQIGYLDDQLLKGVNGANRAGYGATVLVAPCGTGDNVGVRLLQRPLEAVLRPHLGLPERVSQFERFAGVPDEHASRPALSIATRQWVQRLFWGSAAVAAATGGLEIADGQVLAGVLTETWAGGFADLAVQLRPRLKPSVTIKGKEQPLLSEVAAGGEDMTVTS